MDPGADMLAHTVGIVEDGWKILVHRSRQIFLLSETVVCAEVFDQCFSFENPRLVDGTEAVAVDEALEDREGSLYGIHGYFGNID